MFDWALRFLFCEVYHIQNLIGFELPIKHAHGVISAMMELVKHNDLVF